MSQTITAPAAPEFLTLPVELENCQFADFSPLWFLSGLSQWIDQNVTNALLQLRRVEFDRAETNAGAVAAADRSNVSPVNSPFGDLFSAFSEDSADLSDFFFFALNRARHEHTLTRFEFWHQMTADYVPAKRFNAERESEFASMWSEYLETEASWYQSAWQSSGLTVADLLAGVMSYSAAKCAANAPGLNRFAE